MSALCYVEDAADVWSGYLDQNQTTHGRDTRNASNYLLFVQF